MSSPFLADIIYDDGLNVLRNASLANDADLHICSQAPTTFTEATDTFTFGNKEDITISAPADIDNPGEGRQVTVSPIVSGTVTGTGTATHYAIVDSENNVLLAVQELDESQVVTTGNTFSLTSFTIGIPGPVPTA